MNSTCGKINYKPITSTRKHIRKPFSYRSAVLHIKKLLKVESIKKPFRSTIYIKVND